ncbi:MAG TPA: DUF4271 domain-containing protein [Chitinophagaceae bacterium]|nr:DUF4271 domain-containing protein [Chitinophagaceae bacterium]
MKAYRIQIFFLIFLFLPFRNDCLCQLQNDSTKLTADSLRIADSIKSAKSQTVTFSSLLKKNKYLNVETTPVSLAVKQKAITGKEFLFYLLGIVILLLAIFKAFYAKYFNNIFRVFFNTSLRQNQLTDLLLQAKLPSLIFNTFFVINVGLYAWLLLDHYKLLEENNNYLFIGLSVLFIALVYFGKFLSLKMIGWITGMSAATDQYIFVIFLINKIIGILLVPFIILLAFGPVNWLTIVIIASFCVIGILFLLRYLRSYGLLQNQLKINIFHFLLYIIGIELLPLLLIYKFVSKLLL